MTTLNATKQKTILILCNLNILSHGGHLEVWLWRRMLPGARISQRSHHLASHNLTNLKEVGVSGNPKAGIEQCCSGGWRELIQAPLALQYLHPQKGTE